MDLPGITKEMGIGVLSILQKMGECSFSSKIGEAVKIVKEGLLLVNTRYIQQNKI